MPDLDDNVVALLRSRPTDIEVVILADDPEKTLARSQALGVTGVAVRGKRSPAALWLYLRSRVAMSTHGLFSTPSRPRSKAHVGLWHGELGKHIGAMAGEGGRHFGWVPVSSQTSALARSVEFAAPFSRMKIVGTPRQGTLVRGAAKRSDEPSGPRRVLWLPTYRAAVLGNMRVDGDVLEPFGRLEDDDFQRLHDLLEGAGAELWIRTHPMAAAQSGLFDRGWGFCDASDGPLQGAGMTFYELMAQADVLITDFSSVWIDFLHTGRPMISYASDLDHYRATRGLVLEPFEAWFPGAVVADFPELLAALGAVLEGKDAHRDRRAWTRDLLTVDPSSSESSIWSLARAGAAPTR